MDDDMTREEKPAFHELTGTVRTAAVAALAHRDRAGRLRIRAVTPLLHEDEPYFTLTFADSEVAEDLKSRPEVVLVFSDSRFARIGWTPLAFSATAEVVHDTSGELFREGLLHQELQKFRTERDLIGNMLLQRENWWYFGRHIVRLTGPGTPYPVARRTGPNHAVLAWESENGVAGVGVAGAGTVADTVEADEWESERIPLRPLSERGIPDGPNAALLHHDFSVPDMETRTSFLATGGLENGRLRVEAREGERAAGKPPGLIARWRGHKNLQRRCKASIEEYERSQTRRQ